MTPTHKTPPPAVPRCTSNTEGNQNTATGIFALFTNTTGSENTAVGNSALTLNFTGSSNTAIGENALLSSTGNGNTALGASAGNAVGTASNVICIGSPGADLSDSCFIGNIRNATTAIGDAIPVLIDSAGQPGTASSSARFKNEIKPMDKASEAILALKPVTVSLQERQEKYAAIWIDRRGKWPR